MSWQFWKSEENKVASVPQRISRYLGWRFSLDADTLARLRYTSKPGRIGAQRTTYIRVFDPALLKEEAQIIRGYGDLDAHESAIQFEGRYHRIRFDDFVDRRVAT
jgi:hypothetical protein